MTVETNIYKTTTKVMIALKNYNYYSWHEMVSDIKLKLLKDLWKYKKSSKIFNKEKVYIIVTDMKHLPIIILVKSLNVYISTENR